MSDPPDWMTLPAPTTKRPVLRRIFWGSVRALSLFFCLGGFLLLSLSLLEVLDTLATPFVRVFADFREVPDYRRETAIIGLLLAGVSLGLSAALYWLWLAHGRNQLRTPRTSCPHCGKPL